MTAYNVVHANSFSECFKLGNLVSNGGPRKTLFGLETTLVSLALHEKTQKH